MAQRSLFPGAVFNEHGGDIRRGRRKSRRVIVLKRSMHITLRASSATGARSFLVKKNARYIRNVLASTAKKRFVTIYRFAIVSNHLHILLRAKSRDGFQNFLREISSKIALFVTESRKGKPFGARFFDRLAFSRVVSWGREFFSVKAYVLKNELEAAGTLAYQPRGRPRPIGDPSLPAIR